MKDLQQTCKAAGERSLSVCGCSQELVIASRSDNAEQSIAESRESDAVCAAIEVKLNTTLLSLQIDCSLCRGLLAVLRGLVANKHILRLKLFNLTHTSLFVEDSNSHTDDVAAAFEELLSQNTTLRTLQLHFLKQSVNGDQMEKRVLLSVLSGLLCNEGLTTLQLDHWMKDSSVLVALCSTLKREGLKSAASLHRLGLFHCLGSHWSVDDLSKIASCLQYNTTLRVLTIGSRVREGAGQLTTDMQDLFASAARDRTLPLVVRTAGQESVFGASRSVTVQTARLWEADDIVEVLDDDANAASTDDPGDDRWVAGTVISVSSDYRYCIRTLSGVLTHCSSKTIRPIEGFQRLFCIPPPIYINKPFVPTTLHTRSVVKADDKHMIGQGASRGEAPYRKGQKVELRYYGGIKWHPATILDIHLVPIPNAATRPADEDDASTSLTVCNTVALVTLSAGADQESGLISGSSSEVLEVESCFIRPISDEEEELSLSSHGLRVESNGDDPSYCDAGCYRRGDYVEVKMVVTDGGKLPIAEWRRGRVSVDRRNGLYDVRMENGKDAVGVEAGRLRHHYRARDPAEVRLRGSFNWRPVIIKRQDKDGSYCVLFDDDVIESGDDTAASHESYLL